MIDRNEIHNIYKACDEDTSCFKINLAFKTVVTPENQWIKPKDLGYCYSHQENFEHESVTKLSSTTKTKGCFSNSVWINIKSVLVSGYLFFGGLCLIWVYRITKNSYRSLFKYMKKKLACRNWLLYE